MIQEEAGAENVDISMGFAGQVSPLFSINNLILFMRGPDDGQMRVALREGSGIRLQPFRERLRKALPEKVKPWLADLLQKQGLTQESAQAQAEQVIFGFEPGDMVSEVMSFGSPAPIEVVVASPNLADTRADAARIMAEMKKIPSLRDVRFQQELDYPTVPVEIDRERAGLSGVTAQQVANAVVVSSSSSRYVARNFWVDAKNGNSYQVQVEVPTPQMNSPAQLETVSLAEVNPELNLMIRDVARVGQGTMPGEIDRTSSQRYVSITANIEGEDLGRAARQIEQAIAAAGQPPRGVRVAMRGQVAPMNEMFRALAVGLALAVVVILVLLTAYFESPRLALASVSSVPGVLCGVVIMLLADRHDAQHRVVHGVDHVHRRVGVELGDAGDLHRHGMARAQGRARGRPRRRPGPAPAHFDDRLRHDGRHGADGAGPGARQRDGGALGPGGDRRAGRVHVRDAVHRPVRLRPADGPARRRARRRCTRMTRRAPITPPTAASPKRRPTADSTVSHSPPPEDHP